jgi:DNA-binding GntR family transcriptional regulator
MTRHTNADARRPPGKAFPPLVEVDSRLRYHLIYEHLRNAIREGRIQPGLVLLEGPVALIFGTSRAPVRKAFELLHDEGLLCTFEGRGYLVATPDGSAPIPLRASLSESVLGFDSPPPPLDLPPSSERVYQSLEEVVSTSIVFGHFRIDESSAAEAFGVSRGVVREALARLRDRGLVEKSAYSHWRCGPLTARAVAQDYEIRRLLEPAALAASQPFLRHEQLIGALREIDAAVAKPDSIGASELQKLETTLHVECLSYAPNTKLLQAISHAHMPLTVNHVFYSSFNLGPEPGTLVEHREVLRSLIAGDVDRAVTALHSHLLAGQKRTLQRLKVLAVLPEHELPSFMVRVE